MAIRTSSICVLLAACHWSGVAAAADAVDRAGEIPDALRHPILESGVPLRELRAFVTERIPPMEAPNSAVKWERRAAAIQRDMLDKVLLRGAAAQWRDAESQVKWFDPIEGGADYVIRKFRYEAVPGMWIPGLVFEPKRLNANAPVFLNFNGHEKKGKATPETQVRCINLAKRGGLAFLFEFIYFGQLNDPGNRHNALVQLDLCGTSGVAPFVLALTRGLDLAMAHPHADKTRVGVSGLSGGGWQTIMLAALDERVTLANPVAGHASMFTRAQYSRDVGDCEQIPSDMCTVADYTHLTALVGPRPLLLTFNAKDNCCFLPEGSLPLLEAATRPIYNLHGASHRFRTHVNHVPGTHNFERENREMFYRLVGESFFVGDTSFDPGEIAVPDSELKSGDELLVPMPAENATLHSLALKLSSSLPDEHPAADPTAVRERLRRVVRLEHYESRPKLSAESESDDVKIMRWQVRMSDAWTVPAVEFVPVDARGQTVIIGDGGRRNLQAAVGRRVEAGERVLAVDLLGFGEAGEHIKPIELQMIATVGRRPLGVHAAQLLALSDWYAGHASRTKLVALGPRSSLIALVAAALEPDKFAEVDLHDSWASLKEFIHNNLELDDAPEAGCFGLLREFDVPQLEALCSPLKVRRAE